VAHDAVVRSLLESGEPALQFKVRTGHLGEDPDSKSIRSLRREIKNSPLVASLLQRRGRDGTISGGVYAKWQGAHWIMATLADIGYPPGDTSLLPLRDQLQDHWLSERFYAEFQTNTKTGAYARDGVPARAQDHGRVRVHRRRTVQARARTAGAQATAGRWLAGGKEILQGVERVQARQRLRRLGRHEQEEIEPLGDGGCAICLGGRGYPRLSPSGYGRQLLRLRADGARV
jgi:hypothetical protein